MFDFLALTERGTAGIGEQHDRRDGCGVRSLPTQAQVAETAVRPWIMEWVPVISAFAAATAAILAGVNLWYTGRREERRWRRDSLVDTIVSFLDGSFKLPGNMAYNHLAVGGDPTEIKAQSEQGFLECANALTRLRVLASPDVVQRAHELHDLDDVIRAALLGGGPIPTPETWIDTADKRMAARTALINAARRDLGLDDGVALEPSRHRLRLAPLQ